MGRTRRSVPALVAVALAVGTAACSSSGSTADPLATLTSAQIAGQAVTGAEQAQSVRVKGSGSDSGQPVAIDLTLVRGKGCEGTVTEAQAGTFKLVYNGTTVWMLPDSKFYKFSGVPDSVATLLTGKYLEVKASGNGLGSLADLCSMTKLLSQFTLDAGTAKGVAATVNGQRAIEITDKTGTGHAYVSDAASPELLRIVKPGSSGGQIDFTYSANPAPITPPPASQTIDGSKYGF